MHTMDIPILGRTNYNRTVKNLYGYHRSVLTVLLLLIVLLFTTVPCTAQNFKILQNDAVQKAFNLPGNSISAIRTDGSSIWIGTATGLCKSTNGGNTFIDFSNSPGIGKGGVSALEIHNGEIWVAASYDTTVFGELLSAGSGLSWSNDGGITWHHINQPVDPNDEAHLGYTPTTTNIQNITFDIAFTGNTIWIASFGGGLRKSTDHGATWVVVPPDEFPFNAFGRLNHRAFAVISAQNGLWVGTAQGINKSTDGGQTWTHYTAQNGSGITGNFVTALAEQIVSSEDIIWSATWKAGDENEFYGISKSSNGGFTWETMLHGEFAHNFGFHSNEVYVATDNGLYKSPNKGAAWGILPYIIAQSGERILTTIYYDVQYDAGTLWVGTDDGLCKTTNNGVSWDVFRTFPPPGIAGEPETYAYPNPFSPLRHNRMGESGYVRIQYSLTVNAEVTIDIFDFGMNPVKTIASGIWRTSGSHSELWDGTNNRGTIVANGVYFYRLQRSGHKTVWGKIIVLN